MNDVQVQLSALRLALQRMDGAMGGEERRFDAGQCRGRVGRGRVIQGESGEEGKCKRSSAHLPE